MLQNFKYEVVREKDDQNERGKKQLQDKMDWWKESMKEQNTRCGELSQWPNEIRPIPSTEWSPDQHWIDGNDEYPFFMM